MKQLIYCMCVFCSILFVQTVAIAKGGVCPMTDEVEIIAMYNFFSSVDNKSTGHMAHSACYNLAKHQITKWNEPENKYAIFICGCGTHTFPSRLQKKFGTNTLPKELKWGNRHTIVMPDGSQKTEVEITIYTL